MTRRAILTALPATGAALALPASAKASAQAPHERITELVNEIGPLLEELAPEDAASIVCTITANSGTTLVKRTSWMARANVSRTLALPNGETLPVIECTQMFDPSLPEWL